MSLSHSLLLFVYLSFLPFFLFSLPFLTSTLLLEELSLCLILGGTASAIHLIDRKGGLIHYFK